MTFTIQDQSEIDEQAQLLARRRQNMAQQQNINGLLAAIQQLVQSNQALVNALQVVAPAGGAPAPLPPRPPAAVQFAKAPVLANVDAILNYSTKQGVVIFDARCASLPTKYNLQQAGLVVFVRLQDRASTQGWSAGAQNITPYLNSDGVEVEMNALSRWQQTHVSYL